MASRTGAGFIEALPDLAKHQQRRQVVFVDRSQAVARLLQAVGAKPTASTNNKVANSAQSHRR
jgi:hypothetical protein